MKPYLNLYAGKGTRQVYINAGWYSGEPVTVFELRLLCWSYVDTFDLIGLQIAKFCVIIGFSW